MKPPLSAIPADLVAACDYERRAADHLPPTRWAYLAGAAADETTHAANLAAWQALQLWPRAGRNFDGGDTRVELFGVTLAHPLILAPVAAQTLFHPDGEAASVLAAGVMGGGAIVSTQAALPLESLAAQAQGPLWFQLYWQGGREATLQLARRAEAAGYRALFLTLDAPVSGVRNREQRAGFVLPGHVAQPNATPVALPPPAEGQSPVFDGLMRRAPSWDDLAWLAGQVRLPLAVKGVLHPDDARRAVDCGAAGIVVSNHGGRVLDSAPATVAALPGVVAAVAGRVPVLVDGGIRRGTDMVKARALGASAVLIGRPYACALAVAGALGVAHLIRLLREELEIAMALTGQSRFAEIDASVLCRV
jgi:4-hydroxymandelate oxidase